MTASSRMWWWNEVRVLGGSLADVADVTLARPAVNRKRLGCSSGAHRLLLWTIWRCTPPCPPHVIGPNVADTVPPSIHPTPAIESHGRRLKLLPAHRNCKLAQHHLITNRRRPVLPLSPTARQLLHLHEQAARRSAAARAKSKHGFRR
jgi:hypothetical protein